MKILIIAPFGEGFLADSYARAFENLGHKVYRFNSDEAYFNSSILAKNTITRRSFRKFLWDKLNFTTIEMVKTVKPDFVLTFKGAFLNSETIHNIRSKIGIPFLNYYPDNPYCGVPINPFKTSAQRFDLLKCLREYSCVFIWSSQLSDKLNADGVMSYYLPFGVDSQFYHPKVALSENHFSNKFNIVLIGQRNKKRNAHIACVKDYKVDIWGAMWNMASKDIKKMHVIHTEKVFGRDCSSIYTNSLIALNIVDDLNIPGHNMRTFEIPASRGLMLSIYTDEQNEFFPENEAAFYYREPEELDEKIDFILKNQTAADKVRETGYLISKEHTYDKRAAEMLEVLGF